jgi:hypothetical protein
MGGDVKTTGINIPERGRRGDTRNVNLPNGTYTATVVSNEDVNRTGRITVRIGEHGSPEDNPAEHVVLLMSPMGGSNGHKASSADVEDSNTTAQSFGMWPQPPAPGTNVVVQFSPGMQQGILMGSLLTAQTNHNMGGNASSEDKDGNIGPVGEQNPYDTDPQTRPTDTARGEQLAEQGLEDDYVRGHSMSSARRESPSKVFGITTAGGAVLTMDDGAADGSGSQNIRIRTPGGGQILIDDSTGIVFITNQSGSTHIEMNAAGCIDIFSENSFSVASAQDINFHAQGNINMQADQGINIQAGGDGIRAATDGPLHMKSTGVANVQSDASLSLKSSAAIKMTAPKVNSNSGASADAAEKPTPNGLVENSGVSQSAASRVPERHPWNGVPGVQESFTTGQGKPV